MNEIANSLQALITSFAFYLPVTGTILAVLWGIQIMNKLSGYRLNYLGITPRNIFGLVGIVFSPLLHRDFTHLLLNSIPLFLLMNLVLLKGYPNFIAISLFIILIAGFAVWLLGQRAIHIGSSTVIMGYFGYLAANAYRTPSTMNIILILLGVYYFGTVFLIALLPGKKGVSWASHIFGFLAGIGAVYFLPQILS